jgi:hypothetical protein
MKRLFRPDDETTQILHAGEFSPAPTAAAPALSGNGGHRSGEVPEPAPTGAVATHAPAAGPAATATATLPPRAVAVRRPGREEAQEEALWSKAAQATAPTESTRSTGAGRDRRPAPDPDPGSGQRARPTARERPLRARPASESAGRASRPLRASGRPRPGTGFSPEEDEST